VCKESKAPRCRVRRCDICGWFHSIHNYARERLYCTENATKRQVAAETDGAQGCSQFVGAIAEGEAAAGAAEPIEEIAHACLHAGNGESPTGNVEMAVAIALDLDLDLDFIFHEKQS